MSIILRIFSVFSKLNKLITILKDNGITILKTYCCPHNDKDCCDCKKPKTGMVDQALSEFEIDITKSFCVGDNYTDYELAKNCHLDFYGIKGINNDDIFKYDSLYEVIKERKQNQQV